MRSQLPHNDELPPVRRPREEGLLAHPPVSGSLALVQYWTRDCGSAGCRVQDFVGPAPVPLVSPLIPARVTFWLSPLLPELPDPTFPPPGLVQWTTPFVPWGSVLGVQESGAGGVGAPWSIRPEFRTSYRTHSLPATRLPRRRWATQARSHPLATVATTSAHCRAAEPALA